jgi:hypothetical protein
VQTIDDDNFTIAIVGGAEQPAAAARLAAGLRTQPLRIDYSDNQSFPARLNARPREITT